MLKKKTLAVVVSGLLLLALFVSGGCLGSSDTAKEKKLLVTHDISKEDVETFKEKGVTVVNYSKEGLFKSRRVMIPGADEISAEQAAEIKAMFDEDGNASVTLYEPTPEKIERLKKLLDVENFAGLQGDTLTKDKDGNEDPDTLIVVYSVGKDSNGNILSHAQVKHGFNSRFHVLKRDDNILKEDVDGGKVWVKYNNSNDIATPYDVIQYVLSEEIPDTEGTYYEITEERVIGKVGEDAVKVDEENKKITVTLNDGTEYDCLYFNKGTKMYEVLREGKELPEGEPTVIEITKDPLTAEEKKEQDAQARKCNIGNFADWTFTDNGDLKDKFADSGYVKPKTITEKIVAWAKSTFGGKGVACADEKAELFDVATITETSIGETFSNLKNLMLSGTITIASAHHFSGDAKDGGDDYYLVKQAWAFNNAMKKYHEDGGWKYKGKVAEKFGESRTMATAHGDIDEFYLCRYEIHSAAKSGLKATTDVVCRQAAPEPYNKQTTTSVTHGWNIGASANAGCGKMGDKGKMKTAGLSLSAGYQSSKTSSYSTYDIEVVALNNAQNKIDWKYETKGLPQKKNTNDLTYPADLATSTYSPQQCFIWQIATNKRSKYTDSLLQVSVDVGVGGSYRKMWKGGKIERHDYNVKTKTYSIKPTKPALFCIDKATLNFNESPIIAQYVYVYSQGDWKWENPAEDWLEVKYTPSNRQLSICPKPNRTGETRTAVIKLSRTAGSSADEWENERTITVTQSPYSK